jgi:hypothetical protein
MMNKMTNASEKSAGSQDNIKKNRVRDIIAAGVLYPQPLKLQRGSGKAKKGNKRRIRKRETRLAKNLIVDTTSV